MNRMLFVMCSLEIFNVFINKQKNPYKDKFVMRFKIKLSDWFAVYDVWPYWNLIGQNEDILTSSLRLSQARL